MEELFKMFNDSVAKMEILADEQDKVIFKYFGQEFDKTKILIIPDRFNTESFPKSNRVKFSKYTLPNEGYIVDEKIYNMNYFTEGLL